MASSYILVSWGVWIILNEGFISHQWPQVLFGLHAVLQVKVVLVSFSEVLASIWNIHVQNGSSPIKPSEELNWKFYPLRPTGRGFSWQMTPPVIWVGLCSSPVDFGDILAPLRLRVEQRTSCLSLAERCGTHQQRLEELLGWCFVVRCEVYIHLLYFKWFKRLRSNKSYTVLTWNMKCLCCSRCLPKVKLCIWYMLIDCLKSSGCSWRTKGTTCVCEPYVHHF